MTIRSGIRSGLAPCLAQLALIVDLQKQRDSLTSGLVDRYYQARHTLETLFGRQRGFEVLAIDGETPRDPRASSTRCGA